VYRCHRSLISCFRSTATSKRCFTFWSANLRYSIAATDRTMRSCRRSSNIFRTTRRSPSSKGRDDLRETKVPGRCCGILADQEFLREDFHFAVHDFIEHQRQHLKKEEQLLFPAAVKALQREDWAEIDARLHDCTTGRTRCSTAWWKKNFLPCKTPSCGGSRRPRKPVWPKYKCNLEDGQPS
jgi:hypothetical protein